MATLDVTPADEIDRQELLGSWEKSMNTLTEIINASGGVTAFDDPTSAASRALFKMQKELDTQSLESAQNLEMYNAQMDMHKGNPEDYDSEETKKRIEYYSGLKTMKERTDFLNGRTNMPGHENKYTEGLLVPSLDKFAPLDNVVRTTFDSTKENGDITTMTKGAAREKIKAQVLATLTGNDAYAKHVRVYGDDLEKYVDELTDKAVAEVHTQYSKTEDEGSRPFEMNFGGGIQETGDYRFAYGTHEGDRALVDDPLDENSRVAAYTSSYPNVAISRKDGKAPVFDYNIREDGKQLGANIRATEVIRKDGELYLRGTLASDVQDPDQMFARMFGGSGSKNELVEVPLNQYGNQEKFAAQFGITTSELNQNMDSVVGQQEERNEQLANQSYEQDIEASVLALGNGEANGPNLESIENYMKDHGVTKNKYSIDGTTISVGALKFDMSWPFGRKQFFSQYKK